MVRTPATNRLPPLKWTLAVLAILTTIFQALPLAAQECTAADADIFNTSRRAQGIVSHYDSLHRVHRDDLQRNLDFAERTEQELPWRFALAGIVSRQSTSGFEVCTNQGNWPAGVGPYTAGGILSVDFYRWNFGVQAFALLVNQTLEAQATQEQTRTDDGQYTDPQGIAYASVIETIYGGRFTLFPWASVVVGYVVTGGVSNMTGDDGRRFILPDEDSQRAPRWYIGTGSPYGDTSFHLMVDPDDVAADVLELRSEAIPLPVEFDAVGIAGLSYIRDESQVVLEAGVGQIFDFLTLTTAVEFNPIRLRETRLRLEWTGGPEKILEDTLEDGEEVAMRMAFDTGAFLELSHFNSRHLEDQTGRNHATGVAFGGTVRPDITILMGQLDLWFGVNRPDELARISDFVGRWQMGVRFHARFGL